jgi:hypothetical protein
MIPEININRHLLDSLSLSLSLSLREGGMTENKINK